MKVEKLIPHDQFTRFLSLSLQSGLYFGRMCKDIFPRSGTCLSFLSFCGNKVHGLPMASINCICEEVGRLVSIIGLAFEFYWFGLICTAWYEAGDINEGPKMIIKHTSS